MATDAASAAAGSGSTSAHAEYWAIAMPNGEDESATMRQLTANLSSSGESDLAEVFHFDIPALRVGTLERLMNSGDQLAKADLNIEGVIRKIERQFNEVNLNNETLSVDGQPVIRYIQSFRWNNARYQYTRPIEELVKTITQSCQKIEDELKEANAIFQEKKQAFTALQRKKGGNLMGADLADVLNESVVKKDMFVDTEYLFTIVLVLPKQSEAEFLSKYERIASDAVAYGPASNRQSVMGSPVVPRSAVKIMEDREGYCLYLVTILKNYLDNVKHALQALRCVVRPFHFNPEAAAQHQESIASLEMEHDQARNQLARWCKTHYGETFMAWIHIKAIRVFVEAAMRYGLPIDFLAVLVKPKKKGTEKKIRAKLAAVFQKLHGGPSLIQAIGDDSKPSSVGEGKDEYFDYVSYTLQPTQANS